MQIIFATKNEGKVKEVKMMLKDLGADVFTMTEAGIDIDIEEDGETFEENALIKAKAVMEKSGCIVLADDSGLEIDYLNGDPLPPGGVPGRAGAVHQGRPGVPPNLPGRHDGRRAVSGGVRHPDPACHQPGKERGRP